MNSTVEIADSADTGALVERANCFHCGESCPENTFARGEKLFCCQGCLMVHDLLAESGLDHFYNLSSHPGVRVRGAARREQWAYLDEPAVQPQLLDFTDGKQSRVTFQIPAIHCVACVWLLENLFRLHPGVGRSQVNFLKREAAITFAAQKIRLSELVALLASIGYEPALTLGELEKKETSPARKRQWLQVGLAGFAFGNIMLFSLPAYIGMDSVSAPVFRMLFGYLSLALALPVVIFSAADYWKTAFFSLRQRVLTLDVPIALGLAALYAQSAFEIISGHGEGYLDSTTGLIFFLLCGRIFQQKTHERLAFDRDYKSFFPLSVIRLRCGREEDPDSEREERVSLSQLEVGDCILIRHGELIPADARLASPNALIDYSFVTGESEPVAKSNGDHLYAGGQQTGGAIEVEIVKPVSHSYLTSLWNHETFQKKRDDNLNSLTNRYSRRFTLIVLGIALGAVAFWVAAGDSPRALKAFASVLIVACPCALALAAPFTLGTAQRLLARFGAFLRNSLVIERMAQVNAIVFDKTGTLTAPTAAEISFEGEPLTALEKSWITSLARHSTHPLSARIVAFLGSEARETEDFIQKEGAGLSGKVDGHEILIGSRAWLESQNVVCRSGGSETRTSEMDSATRVEATRPPGSCTGIAIDGRFRGAFQLAGNLRENTDQLIANLASRYEIALLSGDHELERERFRALFGGDARLHFNQSPLDKLGFIQRLQHSGKVVMMVGDGLNDAGALKQSDVGVAVVERIGAFSPASDVILEAGRVTQLFELLAFARKSARIVRFGFAISALYNVVGVSIAAAGILSPLICAILMPLSSVSVVLFACGVTQRAAKGLIRKPENRTPKDQTPKPEDAAQLSTFEFRSGYGIRRSEISPS